MRCMWYTVATFTTLFVENTHWLAPDIVLHASFSLSSTLTDCSRSFALLVYHQNSPNTVSAPVWEKCFEVSLNQIIGPVHHMCSCTQISIKPSRSGTRRTKTAAAKTSILHWSQGERHSSPAARSNRGKIPCAFWTSCCPHHLNDGGASSPCVSSQSADGLMPPLPPQLAGHTWNFWESYRKVLQAENVYSV